MAKKIRVGLVFGGKSAEHEVSLMSAKNVYDAIDKEKYEVTLIGINKNGQWQLAEKSKYLLFENDPKLIKLNKSDLDVALVPGPQSSEIFNLKQQRREGALDVIFPVLHGPLGEDGAIQGLLKLTDIAFVGAGVLGSAVGMDKDVMKRLLKEAALPVGKFIVIKDFEREDLKFEKVSETLGLPFFVKPANLGSSVGISKVKSKGDFGAAIEEAFKYDRKILIEEFIKGRELECSVLGNDNPQASVVGELIVKSEFYSYEAKYIDENGAVAKIPAEIPPDLQSKIQGLAKKAFQILCCEGMARVDFFLRGKDEVFINEINTIPGFTKISMYPKMWEASGLSYTALIDKLITLALERHQQERRLLTGRT